MSRSVSEHRFLELYNIIQKDIEKYNVINLTRTGKWTLINHRINELGLTDPEELLIYKAYIFFPDTQEFKKQYDSVNHMVNEMEKLCDLPTNIIISRLCIANIYEKHLEKKEIDNRIFAFSSNEKQVDAREETTENIIGRINEALNSTNEDENQELVRLRKENRELSTTIESLKLENKELREQLNTNNQASNNVVIERDKLKEDFAKLLNLYRDSMKKYQDALCELTTRVDDIVKNR